MESRVVVISVEEYKELLTLKITAELEAKYKEEIAALKDDLESEKRVSSYWYDRQRQTEQELKELKAKEE